MVAVKPEPATATHGALAQVRGAYGSAPDLVMHNMLGIGGLFEEMASYGISRTALVEHTGIQLDALDDPAAHDPATEDPAFSQCAAAVDQSGSRPAGGPAPAPIGFRRVRLRARLFRHPGRGSHVWRQTRQACGAGA